MSITAMKQALEALEGLFGIPMQFTGDGGGDVAVWRLGGSYRAKAAITALRTAIEQAESAKVEPARNNQYRTTSPAAPVQEPCCFGGIAHDCHAGPGCHIAKRLTTPPAAQPAPVQEPVGWMSPHGGFLSASYIDNFASGLDKEIHNIPVYTTPPAAQPALKPLTDEQIEREWQFLHDEEGNPPDHHDFARAIEAAHGIGENT